MTAIRRSMLSLTGPRYTVPPKSVPGYDFQTITALLLAGQALPVLSEGCSKGKQVVLEASPAKGNNATCVFDFERLPAELKLEVMKYTTLSKNQKDLESLTASSQAAKELFMTSPRAILRFREKQFPEYEDFEADFNPKVDVQIKATSAEEGTKPVTRMVRKSMLADAVLFQANHVQNVMQSRSGYDLSIWKSRLHPKFFSSPGFLYLELLKILTIEVDRSLDALKTVDDSQLLWIHDEALLRRAILLLYQMGVPTLQESGHEHEHHPQCDCPLVAWDWKESKLLDSRCKEVQGALRDLLVFLTSVLKRKLDLFTRTHAMMTNLSDEADDLTDNEKVRLEKAMMAWMNDRIRLLTASLFVRAGIWTLLHPKSEFMTDEECRRMMSDSFVSIVGWGAIQMMSNYAHEAPKDPTTPGQLKVWEKLGLCNGSKIWREYQEGRESK